MRIYIKLETGKKIFVPAPLWLLKSGVGMSKFIIKIAGNNMTEEQKDIVRSIDFDELKKGIDILKSYRGLTMVDIRSKDGTGVKIVI